MIIIPITPLLFDQIRGQPGMPVADRVAIPLVNLNGTRFYPIGGGHNIPTRGVPMKAELLGQIAEDLQDKYDLEAIAIVAIDRGGASISSNSESILLLGGISMLHANVSRILVDQGREMVRATAAADKDETGGHGDDQS